MPPLINHAREHLLQHYKAELVQAVPSYTTLLLEFTPSIFDANKAITEISQILTLARTVTVSNSETRVIEIPTYYGPETCLDIALYKGLSIQEIASIHSTELYQVYALGFAPGFAFMAEVPEALQLPRQDAPRAAVPKGSVAIADKQTAVYPETSPGGWNIIGRTPLELYTPQSKQISRIQVGDRIRFVPINRSEYLTLGGQL
ncbi:allophanate hydrolase 2 subunit 1 [Vibrio ishigakensis]|uniref:Allophanate hydrolase 2 subunit 1 n=1 Tax=Vibrio ishigakensis TaxID=1481914 RepID=A0A0B8P586_9VIBR|nr:allophanate hydrolase 2 subunit 1 [Vibrio ishigakensis]